MKFELDIKKFNINDIVTTSDNGEDCPFVDCPTLEWDEGALEG